jgi:hypothetical protein
MSDEAVKREKNTDFNCFPATAVLLAGKKHGRSRERLRSRLLFQNSLNMPISRCGAESPNARQRRGMLALSPFLPIGSEGIQPKIGSRHKLHGFWPNLP